MPPHVYQTCTQIQSSFKKELRAPASARKRAHQQRPPATRLVLDLGKISVAPEQYKELANSIERMLNGQRELFSADLHIEKLTRKVADKFRDKQDAGQGMPMSDVPTDAGDSFYEDIARPLKNAA